MSSSKDMPLALQVAPLLGHFARPWCNTLRNIRDDLEKEEAFKGLLCVVQRAPEPAVECFTALAGGQHMVQYMVQYMAVFVHDCSARLHCEGAVQSCSSGLEYQVAARG